ncbi:DciA family protein [Legionella jamestowniensis]|nr:DciA family protein [Legionella jamestowniensis]
MEICLTSMELEGLNTMIKNYLPPHLAKHCKVGSFIKGSLSITISNAAFATELRYSVPELRDRLRKEAGLYYLTGIKILIEAPSAQLSSNTKTTKTATLSSNSRQAIHSASQQCNYEPLKEALQKLANLAVDHPDMINS